jgi:hypothetical protein
LEKLSNISPQKISNARDVRQAQHPNGKIINFADRSLDWKLSLTHPLITLRNWMLAKKELELVGIRPETLIKI